MRTKILLSLLATLALFGCAELSEPESETTPEAALEAAPEAEPSLQEVPASLQLTTQAFACYKNVAWTCTSTAQCDAMCDGPGSGVCDFRTLCCACLR
jgi:hypothetical protein